MKRFFVAFKKNCSKPNKMTLFKTWFENKLTVGAFPYTQNNLFEASDYDVVINVSDEWYIGVENQLLEAYCRVYWFPMNECSNDMGINSIYGAMHILKHAEERNLRVYLHCHAGINRSQTVRAAYYFMRTGEHLTMERNALLFNAMYGKIMPKEQIELFLNRLNNQKMTGGKLDMLLLPYLEQL